MYALIADVGNLYRNVKSKYNATLNYSLYVQTIENRLGYQLHSKIAYGEQAPALVKRFILMLKNMGFITNFAANKTWDVSATITAINMSPSLTGLILGSNKKEFLPLVEYLKSRGIRVLVCASNIPKSLKDATEFIEIDESMLAQPQQVNDVTDTPTE